MGALLRELAAWAAEALQARRARRTQVRQDLADQRARERAYKAEVEKLLRGR